MLLKNNAWMAISMYMETVFEEKTPKGITIKVLVDKSRFLAFDQKGGSIYADESRTKILHEIPTIVFIGDGFILPKTDRRADFTFLKVFKEKVLIPFSWRDAKKNRYLFIHIGPSLDLIPVKLHRISNVAAFVRELETGLKPAYLIVDTSITRADILIIKNRYPAAQVVLVDESSETITVRSAEEAAEISDTRRATDIAREININTMSNNPVFLARLHLRELNFSKVNQLLFDFDLPDSDAEYIMSFLETMIKRAEDKEELAKNLGKIESLRNAFLFYRHLLGRHDEDIRLMIDTARDRTDVASYRTLIAKIKILFPEQADQLQFTDYENLLYERNENLQE